MGSRMFHDITPSHLCASLRGRTFHTNFGFLKNGLLFLAVRFDKARCDVFSKFVIKFLFLLFFAVEVSFYSSESVTDDVSWVPNKHYSGIYGLLKLTLPKLLPQSLTKVIVLDTDVTLATDISKVKFYFAK